MWMRMRRMRMRMGMGTRMRMRMREGNTQCEEARGRVLSHGDGVCECVSCGTVT